MAHRDGRPLAAKIERFQNILSFNKKRNSPGANAPGQNIRAFVINVLLKQDIVLILNKLSVTWRAKESVGTEAELKIEVFGNDTSVFVSN